MGENTSLLCQSDVKAFLTEVKLNKTGKWGGEGQKKRGTEAFNIFGVQSRIGEDVSLFPGVDGWKARRTRLEFITGDPCKFAGDER